MWSPWREYFGPLLFIIYMNDLLSSITICKTLLFIDNTKICNSIHDLHDITVLQRDSNIVF